jgi:hypothetical protein
MYVRHEPSIAIQKSGFITKHKECSLLEDISSHIVKTDRGIKERTSTTDVKERKKVVYKWAEGGEERRGWRGWRGREGEKRRRRSLVVNEDGVLGVVLGDVVVVVRRDLIRKRKRKKEKERG